VRHGARYRRIPTERRAPLPRRDADDDTSFDADDNVAFDADDHCLGPDHDERLVVDDTQHPTAATIFEVATALRQHGGLQAAGRRMSILDGRPDSE
jgi:hypothetical protein